MAPAVPKQLDFASICAAVQADAALTAEVEALRSGLSERHLPCTRVGHTLGLRHDFRDFTAGAPMPG